MSFWLTFRPNLVLRSHRIGSCCGGFSRDRWIDRFKLDSTARLNLAVVLSHQLGLVTDQTVDIGFKTQYFAVDSKCDLWHNLAKSPYKFVKPVCLSQIAIVDNKLGVSIVFIIQIMRRRQLKLKGLTACCTSNLC